MSKYLIINADDFGYNPQQTKAIDELMRGNLITSTSLMTVAPDAANAAELARLGGYPVGVHLTINSDDSKKRWQSNSGAPSLSEKGMGLYESQVGLALHARRRDVRAELEAQYNFISSRGVEVDHADNHCATLYGINGRRFYIDAYNFCAEHSLPYRFPKTSGFLSRQIGREAPLPLRTFQTVIVNAGLKRGVRLLDDLVSNPWPVGRIGSYETLRDYYIEAVKNCVGGVTEIFLHPAYPVEDESEEWQKRVWELQLLKSGELIETAKKNNIELISWADLSAVN